ncbi:MAG: multiprotein-bridging factor 1 family protein [Cyclobacteriaceae bacterium]
MTNTKRAEGHTSKVLGALLEEITPQEQARTENKMLLALKIDEAREAKGWTKLKFAEEMGKQPSEISKWLSGTHNFTSDTLWDIGEKLGIELIFLNERSWKVTKIVEYRTVVTGSARPTLAGFYKPYTAEPAINKKSVASKTFVYG